LAIIGGSATALVVGAALVAGAVYYRSRRSEPAVTPTAWTEITKGIGHDAVPVDVALKAFAATVGPIPGVVPPPADDSLPFCSTLPVLWVREHWTELKPDQKRAVEDALAPRRPLAVKNQLHWFDGGAPVADAFKADMEWAKNAVESFLTPGESSGRVDVLVLPPGQSIDARGADAKAIPVVQEAWSYRLLRPDENPNTGRCLIQVSPTLPSAAMAYRRFVLVHELTHCMQYAWVNIGTTFSKVGWVMEGFAQWVAWTTVGPFPLDWPVMLDGTPQLPGMLDIHVNPYQGGLSLFLRAQRHGVPAGEIARRGAALVNAGSSSAALAIVEGLRAGVLTSWASEALRKAELNVDGEPGWDFSPSPLGTVPEWTPPFVPPAANLWRRPAEGETLTTTSRGIQVLAGDGVQQVTHVSFASDLRGVRVFAFGAGRGVFATVATSGAVDTARAGFSWAGDRELVYCFVASACPSGGVQVARERGLLLALSGGSQGARVLLQPLDEARDAGPPAPDASGPVVGQDRCLLGTWDLDPNPAVSTTFRTLMGSPTQPVVRGTIRLAFTESSLRADPRGLSIDVTAAGTPGSAQVRSTVTANGFMAGPWRAAGGTLETTATQNTWQFAVSSRVAGRTIDMPVPRDQLGFNALPQRARYRCSPTLLVLDQNDGAGPATSTYRKVR
jgi:hypothetical protein